MQGDLVEAMAEVHFGVAGSSFEEVSDFLYCFYMVGCPFECFVCLSHVNVHSYLLLILFSVMTAFDIHGLWSSGLTSSILFCCRRVARCSLSLVW